MAVYDEAFALGYRDEKGMPWFLSRAAIGSNLMRTSRLYEAVLFAGESALIDFLSRLRPEIRAAFNHDGWFVVPICLESRGQDKEMTTKLRDAGAAAIREIAEANARADEARKARKRVNGASGAAPARGKGRSRRNPEGAE